MLYCIKGESMNKSLKLRGDIHQLPILFSQVREDPKIDLELIKSIPGNNLKVLMIASGGETLCTLATNNRIQSIDAVDANSSQIELCKLKHLLLGEPRETRLKALGHIQISQKERSRLLMTLTEKTDINLDILGPKDLLNEEGPNFTGRYEQLFKGIQSEISTNFDNLPEVFNKYFELDLLVHIFEKEATQNPLKSFSEHFITQTKFYLAKDSNAESPFLSQMLKGVFHARPYHYFELGIKSKKKVALINYHHKMMIDFLLNAEREKYNLIHLSNILDWLSESEATKALKLAKVALAKNGKIIIRQLNSSLNIPKLPTELLWDKEWGERLVNSDESFFYKKIHIAEKTT